MCKENDFINPLGQFNWNANIIANDYDTHADIKRFKSNLHYLDEIFDPLPETDRQLYSLLIDRVQNEFHNESLMELETYAGIVYWKLYSQPMALRRLIGPMLQSSEAWAPEVEGDIRTMLIYLQLENILPFEISKKAQTVIDLVTSFNYLPCTLRGMTSPAALPMRMTFLHFVYPDIVPLFDKMVLRALGVSRKNASNQIDCLYGCIDKLYSLEQQYLDEIVPISNTLDIGYLRALDMALWVMGHN